MAVRDMRKATPTEYRCVVYRSKCEAMFARYLEHSHFRARLDANVSMTQLSIARHYGGCKVDGKHFVYNPADDSLIREDVFKWIAKQKKAGKSR